MIYGFNRFKPYTINEIQDYYYGMGCYNIFFSMLDNIKDNQQLPHRWRQISHLMYEHKKIMGIRIKYLKEKKYLINSDVYGNAYNVIGEKMLVARNLLMKYSLNNNKLILDRVKYNLISVMNMEKDIIPKLINDIILH